MARFLCLTGWVRQPARLAAGVMVGVVAFASSAYAKCDGDDPRIRERIKAIDNERKVLQKGMMAAKFVGKEVKRGRCAATLLRIGAPAPFALAPDESVREAHEVISCLALEKWQLQQECKCHDRGSGFSRDEAEEKETLEAYKDVQAIRTKALKIGVPNKVIRSFVDRADEIKSCFDTNTVSVLRKIEHDVRVIVEAGPGPRSEPH